MQSSMPVTYARKILLQLVDKVDEEYTRVDLTKKGSVRASLVSPGYIDALEETIFSLKHSLKDVNDAEKEIRQGKTVSVNQLKEKIRHAC